MYTRVLILDMGYLLNRCLHVKALANLHSQTGEPTGGVFGCLNSIQKCLCVANPCEKVIGVWDSGKSERRLALFPPDAESQTGYKANRLMNSKTPPVERAEKEVKYRLLKHQQEKLTPLMQMCGVHAVTWPGREADDVIAVLAKELAGKHFQQVVLGTDDWDYAQCVTDTTVVYRPLAEEWISLHNFIERLGVPIDWAAMKKSIEGDTSDNIPGINGVGPKTVASLVEEFVALSVPGFQKSYYDAHQYRNTFPSSNLDQFFAFCAQKKGKNVQKLVAEKAIVLRNLELVELHREVFPREHVDYLVSQLMLPLAFREMDVVREFGNLNINKMLENFAAWSSPFRSIC